MILINAKTQEPLTDVLILLTPSEAKELLDKLENLTSEAGEHIHINNDEFSKELTVAVYTRDNARYFAKEITKLIKKELFDADR